MKMPNWVERAVCRSSERSWTLGFVFEQYCNIERVTRVELASSLGCTLDDLAWLSLCRKPVNERFYDDVGTITERFGLDPKKLAQVIRHVEVVRTMQNARATQVRESMLLAARDRDDEDETS